MLRLAKHSRLISATAARRDVFRQLDSFSRRHIGPEDIDILKMCAVVGVSSLENLSSNTVPAQIAISQPTRLGPALTETETLQRISAIASKNTVLKSYIGLGYYGTNTPKVILRNVMENPGWYVS